jgi:hypothetical protein
MAPLTNRLSEISTRLAACAATNTCLAPLCTCDATHDGLCPTHDRYYRRHCAECGRKLKGDRCIETGKCSSCGTYLERESRSGEWHLRDFETWLPLFEALQKIP